MNFLDHTEAEQLAPRLLRDKSDGEPRMFLFYQGGRHADAGRAIAAAPGRFTEAMLLFRFAVHGDGWGSPRPEWRRFGAWRTAMGESRRLADAPGHVFAAHETEHFATALAFAMELGWDAVVAVKPKRQLLWLSHDDFIEVHRGFGGGALRRALISLGFRPPRS
jgi:hypothetical protein